MSKKMNLPMFQAAEPLRKRVPALDEHGKPLSDFMVLIPGLIKKPQHLIQTTIERIQIVFANFTHVVVFADLNLKLSLLWVSVKPVPGVHFQISEALRAAIPEARLVSPI
ncbi:MAG: hypothetical protein NUV51_03170 [Sulfuricaulis sp.]|nr:hypothetical protein [Sulfuricaulis sp.]